MSDKSNSNPRLTRRQLVQRGAAATAAVLLTGCVAESVSEQDAATPTRAVAQQRASATPPPLTATSVPAETSEPPAALAEAATAEPAATSTTEPAPPTATAMLEPTPACDDDDDDPTLSQTEGPFYTPSTPERTSFLADGPGTKFVLVGRVLTTSCQPIEGAIVDFWHASDAGEYDNSGYLFRGHQFTDAAGSYRLETVVPGLYPGRTRHFHVKVQGPTTALLTTQLYFPNEPSNQQDGIFDPSLLLTVQQAAEGLDGTFDFVLG